MVYSKFRLRRAFTMIELLVVIMIISVLACLLLPALSAAQEKARRTVCNGNLQQIGVGMAGYLNTFDGYFPSWPGWGSAYNIDRAANGGARIGFEQGVYSDNHGGGRIVSGGGFPAGSDWGQSVHAGEYNVRMDYYTRVIACGDKAPEEQARNAAIWGRGLLNAAPQNLGCLAVGGYVGDIRAFFCPSAAGMTSDFAPGAPTTPIGCPANLATIKGLGGWDGRALTRGDYTTIPYANLSFNGAAANGITKAIECSYSYRNSYVFSGVTGNLNRDLPLRLLFTRPQVEVMPQCPMFKTAKFLGNRALVSDTFARTHQNGAGTLTDAQMGAGKGLEAHRDGYNVLYGDGHARWYGDPQQTIVWWKPLFNIENFQYWANLQTAGYGYGLQTGHISPKGVAGVRSAVAQFDDWKMTSHAVWQKMDETAGIDMSVPQGY